MFMGEYHPVLDEKGRVAVPAKLRRAFGENLIINRLVITYGFDKCIMAFRDEDWKDFVSNKLINLPQSDPKNRMRMRVLLGGACECELDKQGRLTIPGYLLEYAGLDKEAVIIGMYNRVEIWSRSEYEKYKPDKDQMNAFAAELGF
jgi:MraZ protein